MADLNRLADAWLAGWDAGRANKPESGCPFTTGNEFATMWARGWHAGVRNTAADHRAKNRFLAISIGLNP